MIPVESILPVALIPAYKPDRHLEPLVAELLQTGRFSAVVVVDDGSDEELRPLFLGVERLGAVVLRHAVNLGKGMALRTGLNYVACTFPKTLGVVTLDADGQHLVKDVDAVTTALTQEPDALIMGCRAFQGEVPLRSRLGNSLTRQVMRLLVGIDISDTQTGLRGIPSALFPVLLRLKTSGYDFELDMLVTCTRLNVTVREVQIQTVYLNDNTGSHFHPLRDSAKIYLVFLRFNLSALLAVLIDYSAFTLCFLAGMGVAWSLVVGRMVSGSVNFFTNKHFVFKSDVNIHKAFLQYAGTVVVLGVLVYYGIDILHSYLGMPQLAAKIIMELGLYAVSFTIQRELIFS